MDGRLEILRVRWQGCKIGNTQVYLEEIRNQKYARLGGMDERLKILKVSWNGWKVRNTEG